MRRIDLTDVSPRPDGRYSGEKILLLVTEGSSEDWGEFEPLRGTSWEAGVELISAESLSHALHRYPQPLYRELGRNPIFSGKRVTSEEGECKAKGFCPTWDPKTCRPGGIGKPPDCYDPPLEDGTDPALMTLFRTVAHAWKEGRHTVVVVGDGFNIR
jgi:hypothetical protein